MIFRAVLKDYHNKDIVASSDLFATFIILEYRDDKLHGEVNEKHSFFTVDPILEHNNVIKRYCRDSVFVNKNGTLEKLSKEEINLLLDL